MTSNKSLSQSRRSRWLSPLFAWLSLAIGLLPLAAQAQSAATGTVTGRVMNAGTGEYLRNAVVSVVGTNISTVAEAGGNFRLVNLPAGEIKLKAEYAGLDTLEATVTVTADQTVTHDFNLASADYDKETILLDQFVVAGEKEGNAKAIQEQRNAPNMKKVIATDVYGDVAEGNAGEFLKMLPGIQIDYVEADARQMSVRGMDPKYSSILMDGMPIASSSSSNMRDGNARAFEFEQFSIASIESVELSKTPTPDVPANSVAGVVNMRSKGAFGVKGRRIGAAFSLNMNEYYMNFQKKKFMGSGKDFQIKPNFSASFSDTFFKERLGLQVGVMYSDALTGQKHIRPTYGFINNNPDDNKSDVIIPLVINYRDGPKRTIRENVNIRLDFKISPLASVYARADLNNYDALFFNNDVNFDVRNAPVAPTTTPNRRWLYNSPDSAFTGLTNPNIPLTSTDQTALGGLGTFNSGSNFKYGNTITGAAGGSFQMGSLTITADGSVSKSINHYDDRAKGMASGAGASIPNSGQYLIRWTRPDRSSTEFNYEQLPNSTPQDMWDQSTWTMSNGFNTIERVSDSLFATGKIDAKYTATWKLPTIFKAGLVRMDNYRTNKRAQWSYNYVGPDGIRNTADDTGLALPLMPDTMDFDFGGNIDGRFRAIDAFVYGKIYQANPEYFADADPVAKLTSVLQNNTEFREVVDSAYFQSIVKVLSNFSVAPGVRVEKTRWTAESENDTGILRAVESMGRPIYVPNTATPPVPAYILITDAYINANYDQASRLDYIQRRYGSRRTINENYYSTFGYLHATWDVTPKLKVRGSLHNGITRPNYANLLPSTRITTDPVDAENGVGVMTAGNPELKPETSINYNVSAEYYFDSMSSVSATYFYSTIKNYNYSSFQVLGPDGYAGDTTKEGWILNSVYNGPRMVRTGAEFDFSRKLDFVPGIGKFFTLSGNYTVIQYRKPSNDLSGAFDAGRPKHLANLILTGAYKDFSGNIRWNWTDTKAFGSTYAIVSTTGMRSYEKERTLVDINLRYKVTRQVSVSASVRNVFNNPLYTYTGNEDYYTRIAKFGAAYTVGVEGRF